MTLLPGVPDSLTLMISYGVAVGVSGVFLLLMVLRWRSPKAIVWLLQKQGPVYKLVDRMKVSILKETVNYGERTFTLNFLKTLFLNSSKPVIAFDVESTEPLSFASATEKPTSKAASLIHKRRIMKDLFEAAKHSGANVNWVFALVAGIAGGFVIALFVIPLVFPSLIPPPIVNLSTNSTFIPPTNMTAPPVVLRP